ncbi:MAG: pyridoxal phosphate-dependent aminotransferase [Deltaproteobacteria bacterium]|nr:pyridoxal phosphate-dependent aminotransferase [Deltaproteobacteria bacterium]
MKLSNRISRVAPSATLAVNAKAQELKAAGRDVISLAVGEPDFRTPEHVCRAAKEAIDQGFTRYTAEAGIPELRRAVAGYFNRWYKTSAGPEHTIVSNGGKQALYNLLQVLVDPGEKVLVPAPYWVSYPDMATLAGGESVIVPSEAENGYLVTVEALDRAWTAECRVLILNSPSNPTGAVYSPRAFDEIMDWAMSKPGLFVISDEIYDQLVYSAEGHAGASLWWQRFPERVAVVNGLAKSFAMTGWRVGYALAHADLVKAMCKLQGQSTSNVCSIAQKAALAALEGPWNLVEEMRQAFVRRRDLALERVRSWPGVVCPRADGAFYLFPRVDAHYRNGVNGSSDLCAKILEECGVALVPGAAFGEDRCIRLSYATADETLERALEAMGRLFVEN